MAILITETTRVIVQGISGRIGSFHAADMIKHGTNVVGGVTPGKGGDDGAGPPALQHRARGGRGDRGRGLASSSCRRPSPPTRSWRRRMRASAPPSA